MASAERLHLRPADGPVVAPIRLGAVPEHFSLPFFRCFDRGLLDRQDVVFQPMPGGTGQMIASLLDQSQDVVIGLSEGLVRAQERGQAEIISAFVESPLQWGIHVDANVKSLDQLIERDGPIRVAISRPMSGSHLMAFVLARRELWEEERLEFVPVGGLQGAIEAFRNHRVDLFLWDRFMTIPNVERGELHQIGFVESPWACFCAAVLNPSHEMRQRIQAMLEIVLAEAQRMEADVEGTIVELMDMFHLPEATARDWLRSTHFAREPHPLPDGVVHQVLELIPEQIV